MGWKIEYWPEHRLIYIKTSGIMTLEMLRQLTIDAIEQGRKYKVNRYLGDHTDMLPAVESMGIYELPRICAELGLLRTDRLAILYSPLSGSQADFKFYEDSAINDGFAHRLFTDKNAALDWLAETLPVV